MTNGELWQLCLNDRIAKQEELKKQIELTDIDFHKVCFEEDMYNKLKDSSSHYRQAFTEKYEIQVKKADELERRKEELNNEMKILEKEIDFIEETIKRGTR